MTLQASASHTEITQVIPCDVLVVASNDSFGNQYPEVAS